MATVTIFGGTGFLGSGIVRAVVAAGFNARIATRNAPHETPRASDEPISHVMADVTDEPSVNRAVEGASAVVNAASLYVEKGRATFDAVHIEGAARVARCAREAGADVLVHISGLGVDAASPSAFVRARARGEQAVRDVFEHSVVVRPSVVFGRDDRFLTAIEEVTRFPIVPLFGHGETRLQPVFVNDVAAAVAKIIEDRNQRPPAFELGGAEVLSYRRILEMVMVHLGRRRLLVPVPFALWKTLGAVLAALPSPPLTRDQVILMESDNVVTGRTATFYDLGIQPAGLSSLLADCLVRRPERSVR
ncbi:MAG: complex I NDUFA9 subunit family protein [Woeseiaceae bacterium]